MSQLGERRKLKCQVSGWKEITKLTKRIERNLRQQQMAVETRHYNSNVVISFVYGQIWKGHQYTVEHFFSKVLLKLKKNVQLKGTSPR